MSKALEATYEVRTATDGARGLSEAIEFRPDLIISDQAMPHMDGVEFCRCVKADPSLSSVTFVLLSAVNTPETRVRGTSNADDFLIKLLPFDQLRARVDQFLQKKAPGAAEKSDGPARPGAQIAQMLMELAELARPTGRCRWRRPPSGWLRSSTCRASNGRILASPLAWSRSARWAWSRSWPARIREG